MLMVRARGDGGCEINVLFVCGIEMVPLGKQRRRLLVVDEGEPPLFGARGWVPDKGSRTVFGECAGSCNKCLVVASQLRLTSRRDTSQQRLGQGAIQRSRGRSGAKTRWSVGRVVCWFSPKKTLRGTRWKAASYISQMVNRWRLVEMCRADGSLPSCDKNARQCGGGVHGEGLAGLAVENGAAWGVGTGSRWLLILASAPAPLQICKCTEYTKVMYVVETGWSSIWR